MKLWEKGGNTHELIEAFTVGKDRELDIDLAPFDVLGSLAHVQMLYEVGLLSKVEFDELQSGLIRIYREIEAEEFVIQSGVEDVHSQVEVLLTQRLGEVGKKIHTGRSRNDQVLVDLKLFFLNEVEAIFSLVKDFFETLQELSDTYMGVRLPGYTHMQIAMPSSFGLWFGAYAESLIDDLWVLYSAFQVANQNPLGSAAGYGSSFPLDRTRTTELLGFQTLSYNVVYAQMGRGKTEKYLSFALSAIATTLNKLASDICLYMGQNHNFVSLPEEFTTGSSIMPHKKNPDVFELIRAHTALLQGLPGTLSMLLNNMPSGYHRDLQLLKEHVFPAIESLKSCLRLCQYTLQHIRVRTDIMGNSMYDYVYSVEAVNKKVMQGLPFRTAYQEVAKEIAEGTYEIPDRLEHTHEGSLGNLCNKQISEKMNRVVEQFNFTQIHLAREKLLGSMLS